MADLPSFVPFPGDKLRQHLIQDDWDSLHKAWSALSQAYLVIPEAEFTKKIQKEDSVINFLSSFVHESIQSESISQAPSPPSQLLKSIFQLTSKALHLQNPPPLLLDFSFLTDFARLFQKKRVEPVVSSLFVRHSTATVVEGSLTSLKKLLIPNLDAGIHGDLKLVDSHLTRLNALLHASPQACVLFLAGSDFFDGLVTCFRVMNPPLRKVIISTVHLCVVGLIECEPPRWSMLSDQLYTLKEAADAHKAGPLNTHDSLVAELVTSSPTLKILSRRVEGSGAALSGLRKRITALETFKNGPLIRPKRLIRRKVDLKGKGKEGLDEVQAEIHVHRVGLISQVQDLFPDLGSGFVSRCLDEYNEDVEQVVANLLGESLPPYLASADKSEALSSGTAPAGHTDLVPASTPPLLPTRRNIHDDDDFDRLTISTSQLSFGKKPATDADALLKESATAQSKAAILSALTAFDSDDDERDDTYDAADVGGAVDSTNQEADGAVDQSEEILFRAYQMDSRVFARDVETRRGNARKRLKEDTAMTDEAIEGWAVMLARNPQQKKRLEAKYAFAGEQAQLERTSWRATPGGSGSEDSDANGVGTGNRGRGSGRGRGRGGGGGRGGGTNHAAGPTGEKETEVARRRKEANKGSRANHNRREGRARKMARGGFA